MSKSGLLEKQSHPRQRWSKIADSVGNFRAGKCRRCLRIGVVPAHEPLDLSLPCRRCFPLSWSHYVRLMSVATARAQAFYEAEAIRGGWSVRQLDRQINTQFYERTSHSKHQAAMLARGPDTPNRKTR